MRYLVLETSFYTQQQFKAFRGLEAYDQTASTKPGPDDGPVDGPDDGPDRGTDRGPDRGPDHGPDRGPDHGLDHRRKKKVLKKKN